MDNGQWLMANALADIAASVHSPLNLLNKLSGEKLKAAVEATRRLGGIEPRG